MTSEVGSPTPTGDNNDCIPWRALFEQQNRQFMALINTFGQNANSNITLPEFDPSNSKVDAKAWITMAEMCIGSKDLSTTDLLIVLNKALKAEASTWLSQVSFADMKWSDFRSAFVSRFDTMETTAAALIRLQEGKPMERDSCVSYASTWLSSAIASLKGLSTEEVAVALTVAHIYKFKPKVRHIAFTTEIRSRTKMHKELNAIHDEPENKKPRPGTPPPIIKCFICGKRGHKASSCVERKYDKRDDSKVAELGQMQGKSKIVCFKCKQIGHIASRCTEKSPIRIDIKDQEMRRVNIFEVGMPSGTLHHNGIPYQYQYDSGSECSLVKASISDKFVGERFNKTIILVGIANGNISNIEQIRCKLTISNQGLEILLHTISDHFIKTEILLGREILVQGFVADMGAHHFKLRKICTVEHTSVDNKFQNVDTDLSQENKMRLVKMLN